MSVFGETERELETHPAATTGGVVNHETDKGSQEPFFDPENPQRILHTVRGLLDTRESGSTHAKRVTGIIDLCMTDPLPEADPAIPYMDLLPVDRLAWYEQHAVTVRRMTAENPESKLSDRYYLEKDTETVQKSQIFRNMSLVHKVMPYPQEIAEAATSLKMLFAQAIADFIDLRGR